MTKAKKEEARQEVLAPAERTAAPITVSNPIALWDSAAFAQMEAVAARMARASWLPEHLQVFRKKNGKIVAAKDAKDEDEFDFEGTVGNCLAIVNKARNWQMDPMAVAECTSFVRGRPCYEGKLIAAVIHTNLGLELKYEYSGVESTDDFKIKISHPDDPEKYVEGTVGMWKTDQWKGKDFDARKRLKYRGDREWCRVWAPALMLGVYTDDEMADLREDNRALNARDITPDNLSLTERLRNSSRGEGVGFDENNVRRELEAADTSRQPAEQEKTEPTPAEEKKAEEKPQPEETQPGLALDQKPSGQGEKPEASSQAKGGEETPGEGAPASTPGVSTETLKEYSRALARGEQEGSLKTLHEQFWKTRDKFKDKASVAKIEQIKDAHKQRVNAKITIEQFNEKIRQVLEAK